MTLDDLGNLGEFLGALAVFVSFVYLATQIRQNTRALRTQADDQTRATVFQLNEFLVSNRDVCEIAISGSQTIESLDLADRIRFDLLMQNTFIMYETVFSKSQAGLLEIDRWPLYEDRVLDLLALPGIRAWWDAHPKSARPEFIAHLNARLAESAQGGSADGEDAEVPAA